MRRPGFTPSQNLHDVPMQRVGEAHQIEQLEGIIKNKRAARMNCDAEKAQLARLKGRFGKPHSLDAPKEIDGQ